MQPNVTSYNSDLMMISTYTKRLTVVNDRCENKLAYKASIVCLYKPLFLLAHERNDIRKERTSFTA